MQEVEKTLRNSCGHKSYYRIKFAEVGVDITSDVNGVCDICKKEDAEFKMQVAHVFSKLFQR
jgi:hypothetical protein